MSAVLSNTPSAFAHPFTGKQMDGNIHGIPYEKASTAFPSGPRRNRQAERQYTLGNRSIRSSSPSHPRYRGRGIDGAPIVLSLRRLAVGASSLTSSSPPAAAAPLAAGATPYTASLVRRKPLSGGTALGSALLSPRF